MENNVELAVSQRKLDGDVRNVAINQLWEALQETYVPQSLVWAAGKQLDYVTMEDNTYEVLSDLQIPVNYSPILYWECNATIAMLILAAEGEL